MNTGNHEKMTGKQKKINFLPIAIRPSNKSLKKRAKSQKKLINILPILTLDSGAWRRYLKCSIQGTTN